MNKDVVRTDPKIVQAIKGVRLVYVAITFSGVAIWFVMSGGKSVQANGLSAIALFTAAASFVVPSIIISAQAKQNKSATESVLIDRVHAAIMTSFVMRFSLAEASLIVALISISGDGLHEKLPALAAFLVLQALHYPSETKLDAIVEKLAQ